MSINSGKFWTITTRSNSISTATTVWHNLTPLTSFTTITRIIFHHDNARLNLERRVLESVAKKDWELLHYPPYSPTETPTDYLVSQSLKNWLVNKVYDDLVAAFRVDCLLEKQPSTVESASIQANGKQWSKQAVTMLRNNCLKMLLSNVIIFIEWNLF